MDTPLTFASHRSAVIGRRGMVAASQPLAVAAGLELLAAGGNAADAAVAAAAALGVTEPMSTGLGGDAFALYYEAASRRVYALNGSGRLPQALTLERLEREGLGTRLVEDGYHGLADARRLPADHPYAVTVPGACAAWCDLVQRFGRRDLPEILAPAIRLAEEGFPVAPLTARFWRQGAETVLRSAVNGVELTLDGRAPQAGEIFRNPGLARALALIANGGKDAFYDGPLAESISAVVQEAGGCLMQTDLTAHQSSWETPIHTRYRDLTLWECPPNGQGLAALLALNILHGFEMDAPPLSAARLHLEIESLRLAFADAFRYVADPAFSPIPLAELLSESYAAERRKLIQPRQALRGLTHGIPTASNDTVYLSVVDGEGNACSLINSVSTGFGSGIVPRGWGFVLQNRGANFRLEAGHPNALAPGKRPYHTIIPALATRAADDSLFASFGVMGGFMQPQGHLQVLVGLVDDGLDVQAALDRPRFYVDPGGAFDQVALEDGIDFAAATELAEMGYKVRPVTGDARFLFGRGQVIYRNDQNGVLWGGSDPRADGCAMSLV